MDRPEASPLNPTARVPSRAEVQPAVLPVALPFVMDRSVTSIIRSSFHVMRQRLSVVLAAAGALQIPIFAMAGFMALASGLSLEPNQVFAIMSGSQLLLAPAAILSFWFSEALLAHVVADMLQGGEGSLRDALRGCWRRKLPITTAVLAKTLLSVLGVLVGSLLLVIPGIIFAVWSFFAWVFVSEVAVLEGKGGMEALRRSGELVNHDRRKVVRYAIAMGTIALLASMAVRIPLGISTAALGGPHADFLFLQAFNLMVEGILNMVTTALGAIGIILLYFDLRMTHEGWLPGKERSLVGEGEREE